MELSDLLTERQKEQMEVVREFLQAQQLQVPVAVQQDRAEDK